MINITLPDGSVKQYKVVITGQDIAKSISTSLSKEALAIKVNNILKDLSEEIKSDSNVEIITKKSPEAIEIIRHDWASVPGGA